MKIRRIAFAVLAAVMLFGAVSCGKKEAEPEEPKPVIKESQMKEIAELSTLECSFHNVAKFSQKDASGWLWWKKDKNFWVEYTGIVRIGIDISRVKMTIDGTNVNIAIPEAQIQVCKVDESTFNEDSFIVADGSAKPSADDSINAMKEAQKEMLEAVSSDNRLLESARDRAKQLLEDYVRNIGKLSGIDYTVTFTDISSGGTDAPVTDVPVTGAPETKK